MKLRQKGTIVHSYIRASAAILLWVAGAFATDFYVAPTGTPKASGSISQPWDLNTAFAQPAAIKPGDKIWLRGGTYRGPFSSSLNGNSSAPIIVRQYPGERAILDGAPGGQGNSALTINGSWTWYWGFEVMNSSTGRYSSSSGSDGLNGWGVNVFGTNVKCINMVVHDNDQGFGFWVQADSSELYGNIIYNNGWQGPDRGHGHGVYVQNQNNTKRVADNIIFNQFSHGIHAYTTHGYLNNLYLEGNISFNNGYLEGGFERNILIGSDSGVVAQNPTLIGNLTYFTPGRAAGENNLGYSSGCANASATNNYLAGGTALHITNCSPISVIGNTFYDTATATRAYPNNTYYSASNPPTGVKVFVRPNQYETGRGNVAVYNWAHNGSVAVDLSPILASGTSFEIRDAENFSAPPVVAGVYTGGTIQVPMLGLAVAQPNGRVPASPVHTAPEFGAFVILSGSGGAGGDTVPPSSSITAPAVGQTVSGTVQITATAADNVRLAGVQFKLDGVNLGAEQTASPYTFSWDTSPAANGAHTLTAVARDSSNNLGTSAAIGVIVNNALPPAPGPAGGSAAFVKVDATTQGTWQGVYGGGGYIIPTLAANVPAYVKVAFANETNFTWSGETSDLRAPQSPATSKRIASSWFGTSGFTVDVNLTDGSSHTIALYALDWDFNGRTETIEVLDASNGHLLDSRTVSAFSGGQYLLWQVAGHVIFRITKNQASNAVISGIFFDTTRLSNSAAFVKFDSTTQGNWKGTYGKDGVSIAGDITAYPAYAQIVLQGGSEHTWDYSPTDVRALLRNANASRIAATWFSFSPFDLDVNLDVNLTDGSSHPISLYCVDWDSTTRVETIDVLDAVTGATLDSRTVTNFAGGQYIVWNVSGHVKFRITRVAGANGVVSALFFN